MVWYGKVWHGMEWYGKVWYGMVWCGVVWYGMVCDILGFIYYGRFSVMPGLNSLLYDVEYYVCMTYCKVTYLIRFA